MHSYSIDNNSYVKVLVCLTVASIVFNAIINIVFIPLIKNEVFIQLVSLVVPFFISFELMFLIFDRVLWKCWPLNKLINYPDISGKWKGTIDNHEFPVVEVIVEIKQTWTGISLNLETETSKSKTKSLTFYAEDSDNNIEIYYIYESKSNTKKLSHHNGTGELTFVKDKNMLVGQYYTDKFRKKHGDIVLNKID